MDKKDELGNGYSLDDFGLNYSEDSGESRPSDDEINALDLEKLRKKHLDSHNLGDSHDLDLGDLDLHDSQGNFAPDSHDYAPQFKGFDFSKEAYKDLQSEHFSVENDAPLRPSVSNGDEKAMLLQAQQFDKKIDKQSEIVALFVAYAILFLILLLFMPQVYLANNIYYASKNINYLKSQREALRDENGDLQQKLESLKFNFLTLEIEEIK